MIADWRERAAYGPRWRVRPVWRIAWRIAWLTLQPHERETAYSGATRGALVSDVARWFSEYQRPILDYLYGMTRDREWAADLTQETFLRAHAASGSEARATDAAITNPRAWLYRIATNVALSALRRQRRFAWLPLSVVEPEEAGIGDSGRWRVDMAAQQSDDIAIIVVERDAVWRALAETPPRWRAALLMQTVGGFTPREIADELNVSEANARKMLFRAKERFRQIMARSDADVDESPQPKRGAR